MNGQNDPIVIVGAKRTPIGKFQGCLKNYSAPQLGSFAIQAAVQQAGVAPEQINEVLMGCVLPAGVGQAPARQAALGAGLPPAAACTTINKVCGSGMKTILLGFDSLRLYPDQIMVAGGMESMSNAPYLLPKARAGYRLGHQHVVDHLFLDGLEDAYEDKGKLMGVFAEHCAAYHHLTREQQDKFAATSCERAQQATENGSFSEEIVPIESINVDEGPQTVRIEKIPQLKPAFYTDGTITAANASSISDGAAAVVMMPLSLAKKLNLVPLAQIISHSTHAQEPAWFTTAPIYAIKKLLEKIHWRIEDVDLFEINEAFAAITLATMKELAIPYEKVNIHGGACVLGHPIGASGARIVVTLLYALRRYQLKRGIAALCIGGGEATAIALEIL